jgi:hypothetical protein
LVVDPAVVPASASDVGILTSAALDSMEVSFVISAATKDAASVVAVAGPVLVSGGPLTLVLPAFPATEGTLAARAEGAADVGARMNDAIAGRAATLARGN